MKKLVLACLTGLLAAFASGQQIILDFDNIHLGASADYAIGDLNGQPVFGSPQWTAPTQAAVAADPTMGATNFSGQVLALQGSPDPKMNEWAVLPFGGTPSWISMDVWMAPSSNPGPDPAELFVRFNGWSSYFAIKLAQDLVEFPGGNSAGELDLQENTVFNLTISYNVVDGFADSANVYLNGVLAGGAAGFNVNMTAGTNLEIRSQNSLAYIDNIAIPEPSTYALLFGALALAFVAYRRRMR